MKSIVQKISGFAKFELDHKLGLDQFRTIVMKLATIRDPNQSMDGGSIVKGDKTAQEGFGELNFS